MHGLSAALLALDYVGVAVFAISGALAAARRRHDVITFVVFSVLTGVGGGTLRDLLIGAPVFWVHSGLYLLVCVGAAVAVWIVGERAWRVSALLWFDAVGLAAYAVLGAAKALSYGVDPGVAVAMGMVTATSSAASTPSLRPEASFPKTRANRSVRSTSA